MSIWLFVCGRVCMGPPTELGKWKAGYWTRYYEFSTASTSSLGYSFTALDIWWHSFRSCCLVLALCQWPFKGLWAPFLWTWNGTLVYLDDVIVFTPNWSSEEHLRPETSLSRETSLLKLKSSYAMVHHRFQLLTEVLTFLLSSCNAFLFLHK